MKNKKRIVQVGCSCVLAFVILMHVLTMTYAAESAYVIGTDSDKDLRLFDADWLNDNIEDSDWEDPDEDLDAIYKELKENWENEEAATKLTDDDYNGFAFMNIIKIRVEDLDKSNAKMIVEVAGDAEDPEEDPDLPWFLFIWSDCGPDSGDGDISFMSVYVPETLNNDAYGYYQVEQGGHDDNGTIDFDSDGSEIVMEFDPDWWDDVRDCSIKAMMIAPEDDDYDDLEDIDVVIDIFPGGATFADLWWLWLLIIIIIVLVALVVGYYLWRRSKKKESKLKFKNAID